MAHLGEIGAIPVPGKRDADQGSDDNHQNLMMFAHYGDHGRWRREWAGIYGLTPAQQMFFMRCFMPDETGMRQASMSARKLGNESALTDVGVFSLLAVCD